MNERIIIVALLTAGEGGQGQGVGYVQVYREGPGMDTRAMMVLLCYAMLSMGEGLLLVHRCCAQAMSGVQAQDSWLELTHRAHRQVVLQAHPGPHWQLLHWQLPPHLHPWSWLLGGEQSPQKRPVLRR